MKSIISTVLLQKSLNRAVLAYSDDLYINENIMAARETGTHWSYVLKPKAVKGGCMHA